MPAKKYDWDAIMADYDAGTFDTVKELLEAHPAANGDVSSVNGFQMVKQKRDSMAPVQVAAVDTGAELERLKAETQAKLDTMRAELLAAKEAQAAAEREADRHRPYADVTGWLYTTPDEVIEFFGDERMSETVEAERAITNKQRAKDGMPHLEWREGEKEVAIVAAARGILADRTASVKLKGPGERVMKVVKPNGSLVQIPMEGQINNMAGSLADGIVRYRDKGFKLADPFLCAMKECWEPAHVDGQKRFTWGGYCSEDHQARTEGSQGQKAVEVAGRYN